MTEDRDRPGRLKRAADSESEVVAGASAVRRPVGSRARLRLDDLAFDPVRRRIYRGETRLAVSGLSLRVLEVLIKAAPQPVSVEQLIAQAWDGTSVSDAAVIQRIRLLRRALGDGSRQPRYIETVRSTGYRLIPPVEVQADLNPPLWASSAPSVGPGSDSSSAAYTASWASRLGPLLRRWAVVWIAAAGLTVFVLGYSAGRAPGSSMATAIGMADSVEQRAAVVEGRAAADPVEAWVAHDAPTAQELAERAFELLRQRSRQSLAHAIALYERSLDLEPHNARTRAFLALALGRSVGWYDRPSANALRAESLAREAVETSGSFEAFLALGLSLDVQGKTGDAQVAYERAVALEPSQWRARASLAYLLQVHGRLVEGLFHNLRAMQDGAGARLDAQTASCLRLLGFDAVAARWLMRADELEPSSAHAAPVRALDLIGRGASDEALQVIERALARGVEQVELYEQLVVVALNERNLVAARAALKRAPKALKDNWVLVSWEKILDALEGDPASAIARVAELDAKTPTTDTWPENHLYVGLLEMAAGRREGALEAIEKLFAAGYRDYRWLTALAPLEPLFEDPRFVAIVEGMRSDVDRQREQVLTAPWLPASLRTEN